MSKRNTWKDLVETLKGIAPTLAAAAGTAAAGPAGGAVLATLARLVTGKQGDNIDLDEVATQILGTPELRVKLEELAIEREKQLLDLERARLEADAVRQRTVNETMRAEARSEWWFQAAWRPLWGALSALAFFVQAGAVAWLIVSGGDPKLVESLGSLASFWWVAGAILGVTAWHRGVEKRLKVDPERGAVKVLKLPQ